MGFDDLDDLQFYGDGYTTDEESVKFDRIREIIVCCYDSNDYKIVRRTKDLEKKYKHLREDMFAKKFGKIRTFYINRLLDRAEKLISDL